MRFNISCRNAPEEGEGPGINCVCMATVCPSCSGVSGFGVSSKAPTFIRTVTVSANAK